MVCNLASRGDCLYLLCKLRVRNCHLVQLSCARASQCDRYTLPRLLLEALLVVRARSSGLAPASGKCRTNGASRQIHVGNFKSASTRTEFGPLCLRPDHPNHHHAVDSPTRWLRGLLELSGQEERPLGSQSRRITIETRGAGGGRTPQSQLLYDSLPFLRRHDACPSLETDTLASLAHPTGPPATVLNITCELQVGRLVPEILSATPAEDFRRTELRGLKVRKRHMVSLARSSPDCSLKGGLTATFRLAMRLGKYIILRAISKPLMVDGISFAACVHLPSPCSQSRSFLTLETVLRVFLGVSGKILTKTRASSASSTLRC